MKSLLTHNCCDSFGPFFKGSDFETILSLLVEAAIHWMEIGLLLRLLKIVVYTKDLKQIKNDPMINCFAALKQTCLKEQAKKQKIDKVFECIF